MAGFWVHAAGGIAVFLCVNYYLYGAALGAGSAVILAAALLGSIIPDCDERHTRQFKLLVIIVAATAFAMVFNAAGEKTAERFAFALATGLAAAIILLFLKPRHRGILHSMPAAAVFCIIILLLRGPEAAAAGLLGFLSHLALDAVS